MPQSHAYLLVHVIFSVKERRPLLPLEVLPDLTAFLASVLKNHNCRPIMINGVQDHVHALFFLARDLAVSQAVEKMKSNSSRWLKTKSPRLEDFAWQKGYGAFSVSKSNAAAVEKYIANQGEHHKKVSFMDELKKLLEKHEIEYDERFLWD